MLQYGLIKCAKLKKDTRYDCGGKKLEVQVPIDLYTSPNIIREIKSERMRWAGHVACTGDRRGARRVLVGKPGGKRPLERPRNRRRYNIKIIFKKWDWETWTGLICLRIGTGGGRL
jgi:hypothetical protein